MPSGGGKGGGTTTATTINPTQQAQLPFLQGGWTAAKNLFDLNPYSYYPNQTLATPNAYLPQGYNSLAAAGQTGTDLLPGINSLFSGMTNGGNNIYASPAFSGLADIASGSNPYEGINANLATQLGQLVTESSVHDYGMNQLQNTASGMYLNSNPYLDKMFGSASDAVTRAYQTATAPSTASSFSGAGRYGSGAFANSVSQNQQDLGSSLDNLSSNIYGGNYQAERARMDAASQALSALMQQNYGLQGSLLSQAGNMNLANIGAQQAALNALQGGYQAGSTSQLAALGLAPSLLSAQSAPSQAMIQAGQGLTGLDQAQIQDQMNRFYGEQQAPWTNLNQYMNAIGQPTTGSSTQTQPYFTNPMANMLGMATGGLGLYNGLSNAGLFGSAGSTFIPEMGITEAALSGLLGETAAPSAIGGLGKGLGKMSDRRLKRDIEHVGVLPNGLSVYSFNYLWDDEPQVGLMADEVESLHPEAVIEGPFGFKTVDYMRAMQ